MLHQNNRDRGNNNTSGEQEGEREIREVDIIVDDKDRDDEEGDKKRTWCEDEAHRVQKVKGYSTQDVE